MSAVWWERPLLAGHSSALPQVSLVEILVRAYAVAEVGGFRERGPARGRSFERVFYALCERRGVRLCEKAGGRTVAGQRSASGLLHEVDGVTRNAASLTQWELKHLSQPLEKNELLVFHGKGLDFLQGSDPHLASVPLHRFLLSGGPVRDECRIFAVLWGISIIEPLRLPLPLVCEAVARGGAEALREAEVDVVRERAVWACRPLQACIRELCALVSKERIGRRFGPTIHLLAKEILDVQEQLGAALLDWLDTVQPDWIDEIAEHTWDLVGGW